uniref:Lipocalin n=1 Tax=Rhipicephalus zambeziensis TaxID=60191 RepID=A0A224YDJ7_9ACAR
MRRAVKLRVASSSAMHKVFLIVTCLLSVAKETHHIPVCCIPTRRVITCSMKQFVDTSEHLWTVKTTKPGNISCQYDQRRLISDNFIIYNTTFFHGRQRYSIRLRGDFDPREPKRMLVSTLDMVPFSIETLLYQARNYSCGVVKMEILTGGRATQYDLRVKNSSIGFRPHSRCNRHFRRAAGHGRCIYSSECQRLIILGN